MRRLMTHQRPISRAEAHGAAHTASCLCRRGASAWTTQGQLGTKRKRSDLGAPAQRLVAPDTAPDTVHFPKIG